jgi:hypothetical protein
LIATSETVGVRGSVRRSPEVRLAVGEPDLVHNGAARAKMNDGFRSPL